jgi:hypothetical protein
MYKHIAIASIARHNYKSKYKICWNGVKITTRQTHHPLLNRLSILKKPEVWELAHNKPLVRWRPLATRTIPHPIPMGKLDRSAL